MNDFDNHHDRPLSPFERMLFEGPPPPPPHLLPIGRDIVKNCRLAFKNFREDLERAESAGMAAMRRGDITQRDAQLLFLDTGDVLSLPLAQRYLDQREYELLAKFLKYRIMYHPTGWLTERNRMALDGMIAGGETALAAALLREFLKKLQQHTQEKWRAAGRKISQHQIDNGYREKHEAILAKARGELPAHLAIAEYEMAEIESYLAVHGSREDNRAIEKFRADIAKIRKKYAIPAPGDAGGDAHG